jgi:hypothetical protein
MIFQEIIMTHPYILMTLAKGIQADRMEVAQNHRAVKQARQTEGRIFGGQRSASTGPGFQRPRLQRMSLLRRASIKKEAMMKKLLVMALAILSITLVVTAVEASKPDYFYLEKVCPDPDSPFCDLQAAEPFTGLNGGQIEYLSCAPATDKWLCEVVLTTKSGDGSVSGRVRWVSDHGYFTLRRGTGSLAGLHAVGRIDWLHDDTFSLEGTYHVEP